MKKRVLSMFMALALCLTLLPAPALADELGPVDGTSTVETAGADAEAEAKAKAGAEAVAAVQAQIDALPDADELPAMDDDEVLAAYMAIQEAYDAYDALTAEQQTQITGAECFEALFGWFNGQIAPLADVTINPDGADANGDIIKDTSFDRTGPVLTENDTTLSGKYYIVQGNITISGDLTVDGSKDGGLVLCQGATLTVNGALIHSGGNAFYIYGQSNNGANVGELIINNSNGDGAAIRSESGSAPRLGISSGKVTINGGSSKKLVDNVELYSTKPIHEGVLDGEAKSPSEWGASSISGVELVLDYCEHHNAVYTPSGDTQHIKSCKQCGFNTGNTTLKANCGNNGSEGSVSVGDGGHRQKCPCGNTFGDVIPHTVETVPTHSKEHHVSGCQYCDYTSGSPETHEWDSTTGECTKCHFKPIAQGTWLSIHDSLQEAMDEASEITGAKALVTLYSEASGNTAIDDGFVFNYPDKTITLDMAGHSLEHQGNPIITVEAGTLKITGAATISQTATSQELVAPAIEVTGGELIFEDTLNVTGSAQNLSAAPAILVKGGTVTFEKDVTATAAENEGSSTLTNPAIAPAVKVTDGKLIFNGKLTATGGLGGVPRNTRPCEPAVYAEGGELEFNGDLDLNGGLTITGSAELTKGLTQGAFKVDYDSQTVNGKQLSVKGSSVYAKVSALLAENHVCVKTESLVEGKEKEYANTRAYTCSDNVTIVKHEHEWKLDSQYPHLHSCACGKSENHEYDSSTGKCKICQSECSHKGVDNDGTCFTCKAQMLVKIENGGKTTYGTDFKSAMNAAENGTTVTLLANIEWGITPQSRAEITGDGKIVTLDLNGHTITGGWIDIGDNNKPTSCTLKIIGEGGHESLDGVGGYSGVSPKATLDLSEWEGGTISAINISDSSNYEAETREAAVIVGPNAGTIGKLTFGNNQLDELKKTKLSGGSFNEIWAANHQPVKLGELLADGYAYQNEDGSYVEYTKTLQGASISNVKVVKCLHPDMKPDATTGVATCEYCGKSGKFAASVDGNLYTADQWKDAFKAWLGDAEDEKANGILKLYTDYEAEAADATWSVGYRPNGNTLDLNGHMMSVKDDGAFKPTNNMHLTVTDGTERGQITNILLDGSQRGSFTLENGFVGNLKMTGGAVVALKGGSVDELDVQNCSANTNLSIQGGSLGQLNIEDWAEGMHVSATGGSLGAYDLPSGKILADVLDHQYYATGTSLDKRVDAAAQNWEKFDIKQAPHDFRSTSNAANVPINGSIPFMVASPGENVGVYEVKWYRRTNSGAEHMTENRVADVKVGDRLDVFCVITGLDRPNGAMQWQVAVKDYTINVVPANLKDDRTVITQKPDTGNTGNSSDNRLVVTPFSFSAFSDVEYKFEVTYNGQPLELDKDYTIKDSSNKAKNAGTHTLTIEGIGNYTGEKSVTWTLEPYELSVKNLCPAKIEKIYDGTDAVTDSTNGIDALAGFMLDSKNPRNPILSTLDNLNLDKSDYQLSNMKFDSAEAGDRTFTGTMTLTSGGNFVFADGSRVMQIEYGSSGGRQLVFIGSASIAAPAAKALQVANNHAATYTVDLSALLPALEAPREYGAVTYGAPTINLSSGYYAVGTARIENGKLILPIQKNDVETIGSVGTVTVVIKSTNYEDITLTVNVNATNKLVPTVTAPTANALTYNGTEQALVTAGKTTGGTMLYRLDDSEWSEQLPTAKNAGEYTVWYKVQGNAEYADVAEQSLTVTVAKKAVEIKGGNRSNVLIYGEKISKLTLGNTVFVEAGTDDVIEGIFSWSNPDEIPAAGTTQAGWVFKPADSKNYKELTGTAAITVAKATPAVVTVPTVAEREYNPAVALADSDMTGGSVTGADGKSLAGTWSFTGTNIIPTVNNKGYQAVFTPDDADNYNTVTKTITVKVTKATPVIAEKPTAGALTYGQKLSDSTLTGGKAAYQTADGTEITGAFAWKNSSSKPTAADSKKTEYDVTFIPSDKDNYNAVDTKLALTVNKAAQAPNMPQAAMAPAHSTKKVGDITLPDGWSWQEADRDTALADGVAVTATAVYTGADKGNYETESVSITITRSECDHTHTEIRNQQEATCKKEGYTGDTYCKDCGEKLATGTATVKKAHTVGTPATCVSKAVCSVCSETFGEVDTTNHVHTTVKNRKEATCTQTGYAGDTYCTDCDKLLSTGKELAALGHDYKATVTKQPTTTEEGIRTYTCTRCNSSYTESIAKLPEEQHTHNYTGSITKEATCTEAGVRTYTCSCGDSYTENIPATGHSYVSKVTKAATTTEEGIMTYTCSKCGHSYTQPIAKLESDDSSKDNGSQNQKPQPGTDNGNQNQEPQPDTGNGKDNGTSIKPYIKDDSGKEGWDVIKPQLEEAKAGDTVTVAMNGTTVVPKDAIDSIKGKNTTLVLDMGNGLSWKVYGKDITGAAGDIDFGVTVGADAGKSIPVDVINNVTGEHSSLNLTLAYDGEFGFTATLTVNMESKNAGLYANLFYYNEQTGELEFISAGQIDPDGNVELVFTHASDYTIVVDTRIMSDNGQADNKADENIPASKTDDSTSKYAWNNTIIIIIGICIMLIVIGAVFYVRKKSGSEEK